ncbi:MAG: S8 family serine peptidase [Paracoccaceae bacterium]|nr:S8 family serine peptidase [Paracoccaceae bacterium]
MAGEYESDPEYERNWGLRQIDAATAYARIARRDGTGTAPGDGVHVALIDNGIDPSHWEFGHWIRKTNDHLGMTHGTAVASVIAARRNGPVPDQVSDLDFHGVAWGIDSLQMTAIPLASANPDRNYEGIDPARVDGFIDDVAKWVSELTSADFVNMSFGIQGLVEDYLDKSFGPKYAPAVATLARTGLAPDKAVLVIAAGNSHGHKCAIPEPNCIDGRLDASSPDFQAGLPVLEESLRSHVVAVVATDRDGRIASFSNRCGIAAKWCIAAPGVNVPIAYFGPHPNDADQLVRGYGEQSGTSVAAPYVTGGLAVLKHWFQDQMANEELLARLYATARVTPDPVGPGGACPEHLDLDGDRRECELSSIFGRGHMDLGAATAPVGAVSIVLGVRATDGGLAKPSSRIISGHAMGDAVRRGLADQKIAVFDVLGAPFWIDATRLTQSAQPADSAVRLSRWLTGEENWANVTPTVTDKDGIAFSFSARRSPHKLSADIGAPEGGHMSLAARPTATEIHFGDLVVSAFAATNAGAGVHHLDTDVHGLAIAWRPEDGQTGVRAGWIREKETFFGSSAEGAFGGLSSGLSFIGASRNFGVGDWRFAMAAEMGWATPSVAGGILKNADAKTVSSAFAAKAVRTLAGGDFMLSLKQPLRIESGRLDLELPTGRTPEGAVLRQRIPVTLEPSGRQIDFAIDWKAEIAPGSQLRLGTLVSHEPGHDANRRPEVVFRIGFHMEL